LYNAIDQPVVLGVNMVVDHAITVAPPRTGGTVTRFRVVHDHVQWRTDSAIWSRGLLTMKHNRFDQTPELRAASPEVLGYGRELHPFA
jgi:hypothetical protein